MFNRCAQRLQLTFGDPGLGVKGLGFRALGKARDWTRKEGSEDKDSSAGTSHLFHHLYGRTSHMSIKAAGISII